MKYQVKLKNGTWITVNKARELPGPDRWLEYEATGPKGFIWGAVPRKRWREVSA